MVKEIELINIHLSSMHPSEYDHLSRLFFGEIMKKDIMV